MHEQDSEQTRLLREILKWIRFAGAREVKGVLNGTLDSEQKKLIYHLSNGDNGSVEIARTAGTSDRTVRRYWETWARAGIVEPIKVRGGDRLKKVFELEDFGITTPTLTPPSEQGTSSSATHPHMVEQSVLETTSSPSNQGEKE